MIVPKGRNASKAFAGKYDVEKYPFWSSIARLKLLHFPHAFPFTEEVMKTRPDTKTIQTIKHAAQKLTGSVRREFQAAVTLNHCHGSPRFARELFGWNPDTIQKGLVEQEMNCTIIDRPRSGRPKYTDRLSPGSNMPFFVAEYQTGQGGPLQKRHDISRRKP